jgi:hypothetical protein
MIHIACAALNNSMCKIWDSLIRFHCALDDLLAYMFFLDEKGFCPGFIHIERNHQGLQLKQTSSTENENYQLQHNNLHVTICWLMFLYLFSWKELGAATWWGWYLTLYDVLQRNNPTVLVQCIWRAGSLSHCHTWQWRELGWGIV